MDEFLAAFLQAGGKPKAQDRMGLDTSGLAQMLLQTRDMTWPSTAREVSEQPGQLLGPNQTHFIDPSFIGPVPQVQQWNSPPFVRKGDWLEQHLTSSQPVSDKDYEALVRQLFQTARPL